MRVRSIHVMCATAIVTGTIGLLPGSAAAACAPPERTVREIIEQGSTGSAFDTLFVGKVRRLGRARDGEVPARFRVRGVGAGHAADRVTVWGADPNDSVSGSEEVVFRDGKRYVVQGRKLHSGGFATGGCTHTGIIGRDRMRALLRLIRHA